MVDQQSYVMQLHLLPDVRRLLCGLKFIFKHSRTFLDPQIVKLYAFALCTLLTMPILVFKPLFGFGRLLAEQLVMPVETIHHGLRNAISNSGVESLRKHAALTSRSCARVALKAIAKHFDDFF